ncbi:RHS repeat domain-containing protein [uncultured Muribaculum sp.]|uniref:RHS repeat domain-containing protein n=1 Tax=uncultured Muribaculum sp. TaxID=1918613 RepID=UPI0025DF37A1|nr:RHS repeat-associated core domain-containing protein [uncultured Muribaculum sp.]
MNDLRFGTSGLMWLETHYTPKERHRDVYDYGLWRGYTYTYDGADRLVSAVYGETGSRRATLIAESPDYSEYRTYDAGSNLAKLKACGLTDRQRVTNRETKLTFGPVKDIVFENRGAQMLSATIAPNPATVLTMDNSVIGALKESKSVGFNYDAAGRLVEDGLRDESFTYDRCGNPSVAQYSTGRAIDYLAKYSYDATGVLHKRSMAYNYELIYKRDEPLVPIYPDSLRPGYHYPWDSLPPRLDSIITPRPVFPSPVGAQPALSGSSSPQAISVLWPPGNRRDSLGRVDDILARTPHMDYAYCGNYEYRNGSLSRIVTPVGYYEGGRHHYQLNDYQGNVRCVVSDTLRLVSAVHYYPGGSLFGESHGYWQDGRLFQGAQLEKSYGHAFYDLLNRHYDPVLCRFTSIDALSENARGVSGYIYCLGNPVRFIDPTGLQPDEYESALMCGAVYQDKDYADYLDELQKRNWIVSEFPTGIRMKSGVPGKDGFQSMLFERKQKDGSMEYAYVYAGTDSFEDVLEDIIQLVGIAPQYDTAVNNARKLVDELPIGTEITFLGHSLGGGLAALSSMVASKPAITFNPAALSLLTQLHYGVLGDYNSPITNYVAIGPYFNNFPLVKDPLTDFQDKIGLSSPGRRIYVPVGKLRAWHYYHSINVMVDHLKP